MASAEEAGIANAVEPGRQHVDATLVLCRAPRGGALPCPRPYVLDRYRVSYENCVPVVRDGHAADLKPTARQSASRSVTMR